MKSLTTFLFLFLILEISHAQKQDIDIFEKKEGSKIIVMARNTGKVDYTVSVDVTSTGMDVAPSNKVEKIVPSGFMKEMAYLTPRTGESWEYSYDVSFVKTSGVAVTQPQTPATPEPKQTQNSPAVTKPNLPPPPPTPTSNLSTADIIVYTKPGCSRCSFVKKQLTSMGITFEEYSTTSQSLEINNMWAGLRSAGFSGGSVTMPVVRAKGKYYYNIPDLQGFVDTLKKS
jgi:glutaredoxin